MSKTKYQDIYPSEPLLSSEKIRRTSVSDIFTLEYFEAEPGEMPTQVFDQHHILINLNPNSHRVENWRAGEHRDFTYSQFEIALTPAGVESGWKWHAKSQVIVITLDPKKFEQFAAKELGVILSTEHLDDIPQFKDEDICKAAEFVYHAIEDKSLGYEVLYESLARVFLVKLVQKYGKKQIEDYDEKKGFSSTKYKRVMEFVKNNFSQNISLEDLAQAAGLSAHHFSRLFKETIGKTPMQFVQEHRVEEAKSMLRDPNLPLIDIAHRCGFSDQAHFSRVFKKSTGNTPKLFRKSL